MARVWAASRSGAMKWPSRERAGIIPCWGLVHSTLIRTLSRPGGEGSALASPGLGVQRGEAPFPWVLGMSRRGVIHHALERIPKSGGQRVERKYTDSASEFSLALPALTI